MISCQQQLGDVDALSAIRILELWGRNVRSGLTNLAIAENIRLKNVTHLCQTEKAVISHRLVYRCIGFSVPRSMLLKQPGALLPALIRHSPAPCL